MMRAKRPVRGGMKVRAWLWAETAAQTNGSVCQHDVGEGTPSVTQRSAR
jgi:hypothetical protein